MGAAGIMKDAWNSFKYNKIEFDVCFQFSKRYGHHVGATGRAVVQAVQVLGGVPDSDEGGPGGMAERPVSGAQDQSRQFYGQTGHRCRSMQSKCRPVICPGYNYNCGSTIIRAVKRSHSRNEAILIGRLSLSKTSFPPRAIKISIGLNPRTRLSRFPARSATIFSPVTS